MPCWEDLHVDGVPLSDYAWIVSAEGLLSTGPSRGDLIELDFQPGAVWQPGPAGTHLFEVPVVMNTPVQDVALGKLRIIQSWEGVQRTLVRRLTVDGVQISDTCQAVMASATRVVWDFRQRGKVGAVLSFQALTPWTPA